MKKVIITITIFMLLLTSIMPIVSADETDLLKSMQKILFLQLREFKLTQIVGFVSETVSGQSMM